MDRYIDDELSLPKATVQKLVSKMIPSDLVFARETKDLLIECCVEFVHLISSEANEICEREAKKTIAAEHVIKALEELGFQNYIDEIQQIVSDHKKQQKTREKKQSKLETSGMSQEELLRQQEELLNRAREKYRSSFG
ncbi:hypothetical protein T552_02545 [Pneumocystis carinii B80]|uniref:Transcription factor CBF/NF-Y/archaeal histone domain-containing protein n=1 Tax=Pneumocystis carinii (strain B80) TaxID=1408658 RepID=A0A0W4ZFA0_PNEC8|nr:hypothetical protein T552_02545 [Pneumocystis carinii B80]KTW27053.1 hypothetical protein T552_02545 [Pneumocystis carinii B80]